MTHASVVTVIILLFLMPFLNDPIPRVVGQANSLNLGRTNGSCVNKNIAPSNMTEHEEDRYCN
jgi:hypothetical protein